MDESYCAVLLPVEVVQFLRFLKYMLVFFVSEW